MSVYDFESELTITVKVVVDTYINNPPDPRADSDIDYHGEYLCEWHLEDTEGNHLTQLENMLSDEERDMILDWIEEERGVAYEY